jgi:hypothetical protein
LLSEAIRLFKASRSNDDIAAELTAAADNLDDDTPFVFMRRRAFAAAARSPLPGFAHHLQVRSTPMLTLIESMPSWVR